MASKNQISGSRQCCRCLFQEKSFSKPQQVTKLLKVQQTRGPDGNTAGMGRRRQAISLPGGPQEQLMPAKEETAWQSPWGQTNAGTTQCPHRTTWSHTYNLRLSALSSNQKPGHNSLPSNSGHIVLQLWLTPMAGKERHPSVYLASSSETS